jgi:hypothetical protein
MMPNTAVSTIVKIAIISLLVGLALAFFNIDPRSLLENLGETVVDIYEVVLSFLKWSLKHVLLGAVVVVPIWLVFFLIGIAKKKK